MSSFAADKIIIRNVIDADMPEIHKIYEEQVLNGVSSWEEEPPTLVEMIMRKQSILENGYPFLVCELDGHVAGYSYASAYRPRPGYRYTVENSIYIHQDFHKHGIGRRLLEVLVDRCETSGYRQMIAVIGDSNNHASIDFHRKMGFTHAGTIQSIGFKFGRWMDSVIMQRPLGEGNRILPSHIDLKNRTLS